MTKHLVIFNWKMYLAGLAEELALTKKILTATKTGKFNSTCDLVICPQLLNVASLSVLLKKSRSKISLAAQNVSSEISGAFTGEVSASAVAEAGASYVLIGHSERRELFAEDNRTVAKKFQAVINIDVGELVPIICIGETLKEKNKGITHRVIREQLNSVFSDISKKWAGSFVVAYEPRWAIGSGESASVKDWHSARAVIYKTLSEHFDEKVIDKRARVLYGGSVTSQNWRNFLTDNGGVLVGSASTNWRQVSGFLL